MSALFDSRVPRYLIIKRNISHTYGRRRRRVSSVAIFYGDDVLPSAITSYRPLSECSMTELFISLKNDGKLNVVAMFTTHFLSGVLGGCFPRVPMSTFQRDRSDEGRKSVPRVKNKNTYIVTSFNRMLPYERSKKIRVGRRPIVDSFCAYNCL